MYWRLHPTLNACIASNRVILLDIDRDRYSAVPPEMAELATDWMRATDGSPAPEALVSLLGIPDGKRVLQNLHPETVEVPSAAKPHLARAHTSLNSILSVSAAVVATWLTLRTVKLRTILDWRAKSRSPERRLESAALLDRARIFADARRWCPVKTNCLLDSLALDRWLGSPSDIRLVFGVLGQPFEAHCWVQSKGDVLNDSSDRVSRFEPILSV